MSMSIVLHQYYISNYISISIRTYVKHIYTIIYLVHQWIRIRVSLKAGELQAEQGMGSVKWTTCAAPEEVTVFVEDGMRMARAVGSETKKQLGPYI